MTIAQTFIGIVR